MLSLAIRLFAPAEGKYMSELNFDIPIHLYLLILSVESLSDPVSLRVCLKGLNETQIYKIVRSIISGNDFAN
jgi:hypothetical protein